MAVLTAGLCSLMLYFSCKQDPCKDTACLNSGSCYNGTCSCPPGFSGASCETKDKCFNTVCNNGGYCKEGSCVCPSSYEGPHCDINTVTKFNRTWVALDSDSVHHVIINYATHIEAVSSTLVKISNFANTFRNDVVAGCQGKLLTINPQTPDNNGYSVSGTGQFIDSSRAIVWNYRIILSGQPQRNYAGGWR